MSVVENRREQMFPVFDAPQMETAKRFAGGPARTFAPGEIIFNVGERQASVWLVLRGEIDIIRRDGLNAEAEIARMGVGQFTGEMSELSGRGTLASGRAGPEGCTALPFDAAHIRALIIGSAELGEILMRAFILRRVGLLQADGAGSVLIGIPGTADLGRLQNFLSRNGYPCTVLDAPPRVKAVRWWNASAFSPTSCRCWSVPNGTVRSGRPTPKPACVSASRRCSIRPSCMTWPWSARGLPALRRPSTPRRKDCRCWCSISAPSAGRRGLGADRELSRLSDRYFRRGAGRACVQSGAEVRRRGRNPARGGVPRLRRAGAAAARAAAARTDRRQQHSCPHGGRRVGRALPAAEHSECHRFRRRGRLHGRQRSRRSSAKARRLR